MKPRHCSPALVALLLLVVPTVQAADPWHLPGWGARTVVEIPKPSTEPGVDTAAVKVLCQGRAKADGSDYRVLDDAGKPVPFQLTFHDAGRYSLVAFRAANPKPGQRFFIYFDNPKAERSKEQVVDDQPPGSGPPKGDWIPRYGLVLQTIQRPEGDNPHTIEDMAKLIAGSRAKHGARYQRRISDGYNSFGSSDYYISIYRGWMQIPQDGKYQFCTASNEASFSFLDGKKLVHWPGRHTAERGMHGEVNALVELKAGLHYIEYYHEEVTLEQMAFLGWRPSGDPGPFAAIPESVYTAPHPAVVSRYEDTKTPLVHFEPEITDSIWPTLRHEGQYTRCRFQAGDVTPPPAGTTYRWDFGDGQSAVGTEAEHIYLALGHYQVTLTAQGPQGTRAAHWPLEVYEIEHITDQFKEGRPKEYAQLARQYDRSKLDAVGLRELAHLFNEAEDPATAQAVAEDYVKRFQGSKDDVPDVRRLLADCILRLGKGDLDAAVTNYRASLTKDTPPAEKLDVLARLIQLLGVERDQPDKAKAVVAEVEKTMQDAKHDEDTVAAYRRALIAAGDVGLWHGDLGGAVDFYHKAETLGSYIPPEVEAARVGSYPNALRDFIEAGNLGAALDVVDKWEGTFPTEKTKGQTFFWRGKLLALRGQHQDAVRQLAWSIRLARGAAFESEGRWLLARSLEELGRKEEAKKELAKLVASGINDDFSKKARQKLEQQVPPRK